MARCRLGDRKLKKVQALMPEGYTACFALVRGGQTHGYAVVHAISDTGEYLNGYVNYLTGEKWEPNGSHWSGPESAK